MSPGVTLTIPPGALAQLLKQPKIQALQCLVAALDQGIRLRRGETGVTCGLSEWRVDRDLIPRGVSLAGAVVLALQPDPIDGEDTIAAAARALGVSLAWAEGAEDAWNDEAMATYWLGAPDHELYRAGWEVGVELRAAHEQQRRNR